MAVAALPTQMTTEEVKDRSAQPFSGKRFAYEKSRFFTHAW